MLTMMYHITLARFWLLLSGSILSMPSVLLDVLLEVGTLQCHDTVARLWTLPPELAIILCRTSLTLVQAMSRRRFHTMLAKL